MKNLSRLIAVAGGLLLVAGLAYTADLNILGKSITVKDGGGEPKRKITTSAKDPAGPALVGNPTLTGAVTLLTVTANGGTPTQQVYSLPQGTSDKGKPFWATSGSTGFKYKDPHGENGPVSSASIKRSASGKFSIKAKVSGKNGLQPVLVVPPNSGTDACVCLDLSAAGAGNRYMVQFGPTSQIKNSGTKLFKAKKPTVAGACPCGVAPGTTTTTSTTVTTPTTTTTTTLYGSPSRAFLNGVSDLLD